MTEVKKNVLLRKDLGVKKVDDGLLILDKNREKIHQLNETASFVWECFTEGQKPVEIAAEIAKKFDVSEAVARRDIDKIIEQFSALGLLETTGRE
jgi:hypothetical protein